MNHVKDAQIIIEENAKIIENRQYNLNNLVKKSDNIRNDVSFNFKLDKFLFRFINL